jgi:hypothetical protein
MSLVTDAHAVFSDYMAQFTACPVNGTDLWSGNNFMAWCGDDTDHVCQNGSDGELFNIPNGNVSLIAQVSEQSSPTSISSASSMVKPSGATSTTTTSKPSKARGKALVAVPIAVGVGVGIPLALLACAMGALYSLERKKRIAAEGELLLVQAYGEKKDFAELHGTQETPVEMG